MKRITAAILALMISVSGTGAFAEGNDASDARENASQTKAFPTAEGGGMYTTGARGALEDNKDIEVYHVTNLNDSGEGSFRDAVSKSNRIIVFDVSGMIDLRSQLTIGHDNITILGQTAPGDGICFRSNNIKVGASNVILRYLRFRVGSKLADGSDTRAQDGLEVTDNCQNVIIDHCSISWGTDENLSAYAVKDVTVQNCIIAEALNQSVHDKGEHSYGGIWGGVNVSFHHNIIATHKSRNPKIGTSETVAMTSGYTDKETVIDMWNNVIYNWGDKAGYGAENGANVNIVNNYYKPGPATPVEKRARIFELSPGNKYQTKWSGDIYASGNYIDDDSADAALVNAQNWQVDAKTGIYLDAGGVDTYTKLNSLRESSYLYNKEVQTAQAAYEDVIANAGARLPKLDLVDSRIIDNVTNRTAPAVGSNGSAYLMDDPVDGIPEGQEDLYDDRGYPLWVSETRAADYDTDGDGIPDEWEDRMGLNKENPTDSLNIGPEGYTWLEIFGEDVISPITAGEAVQIPADYAGSGSVTLSVNAADAVKIEFYSGDRLIAESDTTTADVILKPGMNIISAKLYYADGTSRITPVSITATKQTAHDDEMVSGSFDVVGTLEDIPNIVSGVYKGIYVDNFAIAAGYNDDFQKVIRYGKIDSGVPSEKDDRNYKYIKISVRDGHADLYAASTLAQWDKLSENGYDYTGTNPKAGSYVINDLETVYEAVVPWKVITEQTTPEISINNIEDNSRIGFEENINVTVKAQAGSTVSEIAVMLDDVIIKTLQGLGIDENGETVDIPVSFTAVAEGDLTVMCFDSNLHSAQSNVHVYISANSDPWQIADIGISDDAAKTYMFATSDYTYKISGPEGGIGLYQGINNGDIVIAAGYDNGKLVDVNMSEYGADFTMPEASGTEQRMYVWDSLTGMKPVKYDVSDQFGYVYQKFTGDNRIYYRSRMQSGEQFGIMLRKSLDDDSEAYFFGGEYENGTLVYNLKSRSVKGELMATTVTDDLSGANLYFIAEKVGDTLNIYQTENGSTIYTTKKLLHSIDVSALGDEYYMGFASVYGKTDGNPPDAGWIGIDNSSGNSYTWNFDYGLDWCWQMQEANVLSPSWTTDTVGGNDTGKMVLKADDNYSGERYVFHEYLMDDEYVPEMSADVMLTGDEPAMNVYLQAGSADTAYKLTFDSDQKIKDSEGKEIGAWNSSGFYNVKMAVGIDEQLLDAKCTITITAPDGTTVAENILIPADSNFRTQINTEKKTPVTKAVYFEPVSGAGGTYYIDNVHVTPRQDAYKIVKTEKLYTFNSAESYEGMTLGGVTADTSKKKNISGISFTGAVRLGKTTTATFPVEGECDITIYAASASSGESRTIVVNGTDMTFSSAAEQTYHYSGDAGNIVIYGKANVDVYGVKVVTKKLVPVE